MLATAKGSDMTLIKRCAGVGLLALAASMAACTSYKLSEPQPPALRVADVPPNAAKVCVVRTSVLAQAVTFPTRDNDVLVGATRGPTHFCYLAEPGQHSIAIEADEVEHATLTAEGGHTYFLKQEVDNILGYVKCRSVWVTEAEARNLFETSDYEVLVGVPGSEKLPGDAPYAPAKRSGTLAAQSKR